MQTLLVDDHHLFREGIKAILAQISPDMACHLASSCEEALHLDADDIDLILLDLHLPGKTDSEAFFTLRDYFYKAPIVIVSGEEDPNSIRQIIADGACGFIPKSSSPDVLMAAMDLVLAGGSYLPPSVLEETAPATRTEKIEEVVRALSVRQRAVLEKAVQGKINKVIASELSIAEGTVKAHLSAAYRTLGVNNRTEAVYLLTRNQIRI